MKELKILVADDDEEDFEIIKRCIDEELGGLASKVDLALDYQEVLSRLSNEAYDVGLFDLNFGIDNGIEMLGELRGKGFALPVILMTGSGTRDAVVDAFKNGVSDYLDKSKIEGPTLAKAIQYTVELDSEKRLKNKAEEQLQKTRKLLEGAAEVNHILLTRSKFKDSLEKALEILGKGRRC